MAAGFNQSTKLAQEGKGGHRVLNTLPAYYTVIAFRRHRQWAIDVGLPVGHLVSQREIRFRQDVHAVHRAHAKVEQFAG
jgi:hypothetical protein